MQGEFQRESCKLNSPSLGYSSPSLAAVPRPLTRFARLISRISALIVTTEPNARFAKALGAWPTKNRPQLTSELSSLTEISHFNSTLGPSPEQQLRPQAGG